MKREIKFRCWDNKNKKMYPQEGHVALIRSGSICFEQSNAYDDYCGPSLVSEPILMQFTGLKDKNELKEVYEGDIIDGSGNIKGNIHEESEVYEKGVDLIIEGLCTKDWRNTEAEAIKRGCRYA